MRKLLEGLGRKMFRRPLRPEEIERWIGVFRTGRNDAKLDVSGSVSLLLQGLLQSPHFIYHVEIGDASKASGDLRPLTSYELASRLSYYLWQAPPDDDLLRAAAEDRLSTAAQVETQARRMLASTKAKLAIRSFFEQWLEYGYMMNVEKNADRYPTFNARMAKLMREETETFVDFVMGEDGGKLETLLKGSFTFIPKDLAKLYGVTLPPSSKGVARVDLDARERAGVFTHASFLTAHSSAASISPVLLGKFVRDALLCQQVPDPPRGYESA